MPRADSLPPTPESPPALEPAELLHYLPIYRVLICRLCQYAIQPAAIPRHLKDLHHIYRSNRRPFMEYVSQFELADPQDVVPPNSHECPVPILPIESGVACTVKGCGHMCVTVKRMKSHWSTIHHEMGQEGKSWRNVKLQTFFRGNQLQYFEVGHDHEEILKERSEPTIVEFGHFDSSGSESSPISINFSETSDLDFVLSYEDLELLHHFQTSTYVTVSKDPSSDKIWQITAPELGKQYPFLMYAILACSAMHRAYLYPQQAQQLTLRAANYQDKALAGFRQVLANHVNRENCSAVFAFTSLLIIYVFASEDRDSSLLLCTPENGNYLPPWLQFIRNGCAMLCHVWDAIESGPMRPLITEVEVAWGCSSDLRYWESLKFCEPSVLSFMPPQDSHLAWTEQESMVYIRSAVGLGRTFESVNNFARSVSTWDAMHMWPMHVSEDYIKMLGDWHPGALILMAHFCVLLKRLESNWYFEGRTTKMLSVIWARLGNEWRWTLQWPVQQLGLAF